MATSPEFTRLVAAMRAFPTQPGATLQDLRRAREEAFASRPTASDTVVAPMVVGGVPAEMTVPVAGSSGRTLVYLHGGGYCLGSLDTARPFAAELARATGAQVLTVGYRLSPEHPAPAAVDDAVAALRGLFALGVRPGDVALCGDSAGAGLAVATMLVLRDGAEDLPAACVCLSPWTDLEMPGRSFDVNAERDPQGDRAMLAEMARAYAGARDLSDPLLSPVHADLRGLPPILVQVGGAEVLLDDARAFAARAAEHWVEVTLRVWDDMIHVWQTYAPRLPEARAAVDEVAEWLAALWAVDRAASSRWDSYRLGLTVGFEPEFYGRRPDTRDRMVVRCGDDALTWAQLAARVHPLARAWENLGLRRGDRVATFLRNRIEVVELVYSLARVGLTNATINAKYTHREVVETVGLSGARVVVVDAALVPTLERAMAELPHLRAQDVYVVGAGPEHRFRRYEDLLALGDDLPIGREPREDDVVWMAFTGGTTGKAKACLAPQRAWVQLWTAMCLEIGLGRRDTVLIGGSMNHAMGLEYGLAPLSQGGALVILPEFTPAGAIAAIERDRVTFIPLVPALFKMIVESPEFGTHDTSSVRRIISAGAPLTTATRQQIVEGFPDVDFLCGYGSTETGYTTLLYPEDQERKPGSVGVPLRGMEVAVFADDGTRCEPGEIGTIYKRGWNVAVEYYRDPVATAAAFRDDWHTVGDMGYLDADGYLYLTDRRKNMIITGGINVYPAEVEDVISRHPAVDEVAVIGVPDEVWGEAVCAVVVLRSGVSPSDQVRESLDEFGQSNLASFKRPRRWEFRDGLPKTYAGKISHRDLREPFWAGRDSRV